MDINVLAAKLNPTKLGYSPKMAAIVGAILGFDYGVRDGRGRQLVGLNITSDGFVIADTEPVSSGTFLGVAEDLKNNLARLIVDANLTYEEAEQYWDLYHTHVTDWRQHGDTFSFPVPNSDSQYDPSGFGRKQS